MKQSKKPITLALALVSMFCAVGIPALAQNAKPNLNGIWQVLNTAAWNIQDHSGDLGVPPGQGVVEGNEIPYQPWALAKKQENHANPTADLTEAKCYLPGVPRVTYMPFPFEVVQTANKVVIRYEYAHALRVIPVDGTSHPEGLPETWMGDSRGHWEGNTLVVDTNNFNDQTWFDHAGNFHSDALHVVERYTLVKPDQILYEAAIEDPKVFTRPWKMSMPLYRRAEKNVKLLEYECVYYLQEERYKNAPFK